MACIVPIAITTTRTITTLLAFLFRPRIFSMLHSFIWSWHPTLSQQSCVLSWRGGRHQSLGIVAYWSQSCSCCQVGSWDAHAARAQHHLEAPSPSSQAAAISAAAKVQQPPETHQERCHSGCPSQKVAQEQLPSVVEQLDGRWKELAVVRRVFASG
jgi:hypothetical protein